MQYSYVSPAGPGSESGGGACKDVDTESKESGEKQDLESHVGAAHLVTARSQATEFEVFSTHGGVGEVSSDTIGMFPEQGKTHCRLTAPSLAWTLGCLTC